MDPRNEGAFWKGETSIVWDELVNLGLVRISGASQIVVTAVGVRLTELVTDGHI